MLVEPDPAQGNLTLRDIMIHKQHNIYLQGRILVLQARDERLHLICERETKGAVYCLNAFQVFLHQFP